MRRSHKKMCPCGEKSIPGLIKSVSLCQRHYNRLMFGSGAEHAEALRMLRLNENGTPDIRITKGWSRSWWIT